MSQDLPPLFSSPSSVYRREPHSWQDEDEAAVDASIPSTPVDGVHDFDTPLSASSSALSRSAPPVATELQESLSTTGGVKVESAEPQDEEDEPLRSVEEVEEIERTARESDEKLCRICFAGAEDEESQGRLISPCLCTGSMRVSRVPVIWCSADSAYSMFMVRGVYDAVPFS